MAVEKETTVEADVWRGEIEELQQSLLPTLVVLVAAAAWAWLACALIREHKFGYHFLPTVILCAAAYLGHRLGPGHYALACWLLLLGLVTAQGVIVKWRSARRRRRGCSRPDSPPW